MTKNADDRLVADRSMIPAVGPGQRVGLFGGSFNPPHDGHVHVCEQALRRLELDWVWWLVTPGNPLKDTSELPSLAERIRACEAMIDDPRMKVTAIEAGLNSRFTADTLAHLDRRLPDIRLVWLMGADNLGQFHRWQNWRKIAALMPIAVIDRPGSTMALHNASAAKALSRYRLDEADAAELPSLKPPVWTFLHGPRSSLSSTALRRAAALKRA